MLAVDAWIPIIVLWVWQKREERKWRRLRKQKKKGANRLDTQRSEGSTAWQACITLTSSQGGTSWRLRNKMDHHHREESTEEWSHKEQRQKSIQSTETFTAATSHCWQPIRWPQNEFRKIDYIQFSVRVSCQNSELCAWLVLCFIFCLLSYASSSIWNRKHFQGEVS